jgi:hypothetical protein
MRRFWNRPLGSKLILLLSIAFLLEMIAPWQRVCAITSGGDDPRVCGWKSAYTGSDFGLYAAGFGVALIVWELLPIFIPRLGMRSWLPAIVTFLLAVGLVLCTIVKMITDNEFQTIWAWIGLAITLAILVTAVMRVRYRWGHRHEPVPPELEPPPLSPPAHAEPPPAGGSGP